MATSTLSTETKIVENHVHEIQKVLNGTNAKLVSLKIIYPKDSRLDTLKTLLVLRNGVDQLHYDRLNKGFIYDLPNEIDIKRTLTFLKYKEYVKYGEIPLPDPIRNIFDDAGFVFYKGENVHLTSDISISEFQKEENIEPYWKAWINSIEHNFKFGRSTLWSYIVLKKDHKEYIASAYLIFSEGLSEEHKILINKKCQDLLLQSIGVQYISEITHQAARAAISQVQARDGSHNLGSHVLNKLIGDLCCYRSQNLYKGVSNYPSTLKLVDNEHLRKTMSSLTSDINKYNEFINKNNKELGCKFKELKKENVSNSNFTSEYNALVRCYNEEFLEKINYENILKSQSLFNNYIKCRMDYLSDITFGIPAMQVIKKLKSEVINELDNVRFLLENISGLSNFKYSIRIDCGSDDISVAMPNDILGCQAFYNILENIIRNTAKHSNKDNIDDPINEKQEDKVVEFTINIKEYSSRPENDEIRDEMNGMYEVVIYDNIHIPGVKKFEKNEDLDEYLRDTRYTEERLGSLTNLEYLVYCQNKKLNSSILKDDYSLRSTNLGLIEMEASACYLRKMDIASLEHDDYYIKYDEEAFNKGKLNILKAVKVQSKYLGYSFAVLKPAEVLLIGSFELTDKLKKEGFLCCTHEKAFEQLKAGKVFSHQFLVYENESDIKFIEEKEEISDVSVYKYKTQLPKRILKIPRKEFNEHKENPEKLLKLIWQIWSEGKEFNKKSIKRYVPQNITSGHDNYTYLDHVKSALNSEDLGKLRQWLSSDYSMYIDALSTFGQTKLPNFHKLSQGFYDVSKKDLSNYLTRAASEDNETVIENRQLKESAWNSICVIDERVQSTAYEYVFENEFEYYKLYAKTNIHIPSQKEIDLGAGNFDEKLIKDLTTFIDNNTNRDSYLIIHYSILERIYKDWVNKQEAVNKYLNELASRTNIVVTSGRGIPSDLPGSVNFVNLSPVLAAIVEFRSKYYLHQIVMNSRKTSKI